MNALKLKQEQLKLAEKIMTSDMLEDVRYIGGCDQSFIGNSRIVSSVVVLDVKTMELVDKAESIQYAKIPYIPGYMFYREAHAIIDAFTKLNIKPDILMVDGNGILHPRRIGMASQLGIALDVPTIGISKSMMIGKAFQGKIEYDKEIRAEEVITKEFARPLIVSPGHRISLRTAVDYVKKMMVHPHKLPEPLHIAHRMAKKIAEKNNSDDNSILNPAS